MIGGSCLDPESWMAEPPTIGSGTRPAAVDEAGNTTNHKRPNTPSRRGHHCVFSSSTASGRCHSDATSRKITQNHVRRGIPDHRPSRRGGQGWAPARPGGGEGEGEAIEANSASRTQRPWTDGGHRTRPFDAAPSANLTLAIPPLHLPKQSRVENATARSPMALRTSAVFCPH